jgi:hypothetical protein
MSTSPQSSQISNTRPTTEDPFESLLSLEEQYHTEGRTLGLAEGEASGRIEGRVFGLEKSFEKFIELGRLGGRAAVWSARLPAESQSSAPASRSGVEAAPVVEVGKEDSSILGVLPGSGSERLVRHVRRLVELTSAEDVSRENSEDGVQDFDDRLREGKGKSVLIERLVGEGGGGKESSGASSTAAVKRAGVKGNSEASKAKSGEMEDFLGLPRGAQK